MSEDLDGRDAFARRGDVAATTPRASVVIPHLNDLDNLDRCLDLLETQDIGRNAFEVVVVDNGSACGLDAVRTRVGRRARVIAQAERGAGPARNAGAATARADMLAFIDSDCRPERAWLSRGLAALRRSDIVGGDVAVAPATPPRLTPVEAFEAVFAFRFDLYIRKHGFSGSGNLFVPKAVFDAVGGFRAGVSEDVDWCRRATALGYTLGYEPAAVVGHPTRRNWRELTAKWRRVTRESFLLARERPLGRTRWLLRSFAVLASIGPHVCTTLASKRLSTVRDRVAAVGVLVAIRTFRAVEMNRILLFGASDADPAMAGISTLPQRTSPPPSSSTAPGA